MGAPGPQNVDRLDLLRAAACASCGAARLALNGRPLAMGQTCVACGSRSIRVPRKPGQAVGAVIEFPQHPTPGGGTVA